MAGSGSGLVIGTSGDDDLTGSKKSDLIIAGGGDDTIDGGKGNDVILAGSGDDTIDGGKGHDIIFGGTGDDTIDGGKGHDLIFGGSGDDNIDGGKGHDVIFGGSGDDTLNGGKGNDFLAGGSGADTINGGEGRDWLVGGQGDDIFEFTTGSGKDTILDFKAGQGSDDRILLRDTGLTSFASVLSFTSDDASGNAVIDLGNGDRIVLEGVSTSELHEDDFIFEPTGADLFTANDDVVDFNNIDIGDYADGSQYDALDGDDTVVLAIDATEAAEAGYVVGTAFDAGAGNDTVTGGALDDEIYGGAGDDRLEGEGGADILNGGDGRDVLVGGSGDDQIFGGNGIDNVVSGSGSDYYDGGSLAGGEENGLIFFNDIAGVNITFTGPGSGSIIDGWGDTDTFLNFNRVHGSTHDDVIDATGDGSDHFFVGHAGNDDFLGGAGHDKLSWFWEGYQFFPGGGNGVVVTMSGSQTGSATDTWGDTDTFSGIDTLQGSIHDDQFFGAGGDDKFEGLGGNDSYDGGVGWDAVFYHLEGTYGGTVGIDIDLLAGSGTDSYGDTDTFVSIEQVTGGDLDDVIRGDNADNWLEGQGGDDTIAGRDGSDGLSGGNGNDLLDGGAGNDNLQGGDGADTYDGGAGTDTIAFHQENGASGVVVDLAAGTATDTFGNAETLSNIENIRGSLNNDILSGDGDNNLFRGFAGDDVINGGDNFDDVFYDLDFVFGGNSGVTVDLANGTAIDGFGDTDTLIGIEGAGGSQFNDTFIGDAADNFFQGFDGIDSYDGGAGGYDTLGFQDEMGGSGANVNLVAGTVTDTYGNAETITNIENIQGSRNSDSFVGDSADNLFHGLDGADTYDGNGGFDTIAFNKEEGASGVVVDLAVGTAFDTYGNAETLSNIENISGSRNDDSLVGDGNQNLMRGYAGDDLIHGGGDYDSVIYDLDASQGGTNGVFVDLDNQFAIDGFGDTDTLISIESVVGTQYNDTFIGNGDNNHFEGLDGVDSFDGGGGRDTISFQNETGSNGASVNLATGTVVDTYGNNEMVTGIEFVRGSYNDDSLTGDSNDNIFRGLAGDDAIVGGGGFDEVKYDHDAQHGGSGGVTVNLALNFAIDGFGDTDSLFGITNVVGTDNNDSITGDANDNFFQGRDGSDTYDGGGSGDNDIVSYQDENGGAGVNIDLSAGSGTDTFGNLELFANIEAIRGSQYADSIVGDAGSNRFRSLEGADIIDGGGGTDEVRYDRDAGQGGTAGVLVDLVSGNAQDGFGDIDSLTSIERVRGSDTDDDIRGDTGENRLQGRDGDDYLYGRAGDDNLDGGDGNDVLIGGAGNDYLEGGSSSDTFVIRANEDHDAIGDFNQAEGDIIDVSDYGFANTGDFASISYVGSDTLIEFDGTGNHTLAILGVDLTAQPGAFSFAPIVTIDADTDILI